MSDFVEERSGAGAGAGAEIMIFEPKVDTLGGGFWSYLLQPSSPLCKAYHSKMVVFLSLVFLLRVCFCETHRSIYPFG